MMEELQLAHHQITNDSHRKLIVLVLNYVQSPQNIGLIIRTAEAMGVQKIFVISEQFSELTPKIKRLTRSTEKYISIEFSTEIIPVIQLLKNQNFSIFALEKTSQSVDCKTFSPKFPCAIVVGNEKNGVEEEALKLCDTHVHLTMYGKNTSLNVAVATGMLLHEWV
uniref:TrmH family RNA methyltransferase n=1 Tax=Ornithobacterium rhinotracheale TaxID=28251 RepID=UPI0021AA6F5D|nr:TrmH family RNA methyltransferase [Ornithobacterium rhinotracheale]